METRFFDIDPMTGAVEHFHFDDDQFYISRREDLTPVVEHNKALFNDAPGNYKGDHLHKIASIPHVVMLMLSDKGIITPGGRILDMKRFKKWLNDRDNAVFRVRPGRV